MPRIGRNLGLNTFIYFSITFPDDEADVVRRHRFLCVFIISVLAPEGHESLARFARLVKTAQLLAMVYVG